MKALVEATPISGPASVGAAASERRAMLRGRHVDDADRLGAVRLGVAQRSERVGGFARLRDDDRQPVLFDRRLAIAVFGGDVDLDRQAREALDPVFADQAGHVGGAAGDDRDARDRRRIDRPGEGLAAAAPPMST